MSLITNNSSLMASWSQTFNETINVVPDSVFKIAKGGIVTVGIPLIASAAIDAYFGGSPLKLLGVVGATLALYKGVDHAQFKKEFNKEMSYFLHFLRDESKIDAHEGFSLVNKTDAEILHETREPFVGHNSLTDYITASVYGIRQFKADHKDNQSELDTLDTQKNDMYKEKADHLWKLHASGLYSMKYTGVQKQKLKQI